MKGVFDCRPASAYDDDLVERYHFPDRYLPAARDMLGDWIVYREPRRNGGREAYIAVARVTGIEPDSQLAGHHYARLHDFLEFDQPVPFRDGQGYREAPLNQLADRTAAGRSLQGRSIRPLAEDDFAAIVSMGLRETLAPENARRLNLDLVDDPQPGMGEAPIVWDPQDRVVSQVLLNRKIRDAAFRRAVVDAYDSTCAVSGLRIINGGGRAEVQAAHIWPVAEGGPDVVQNGIALSATAHWLFDRHMISLTDDYRLLVSHNKVPAQLQQLFEGQMERIRLPADRRLWPHVPYVRAHREKFASG
ncbi:MAG: HNH endonuclease [Caulobacter sp.]|nr:HNH endonuclease [Caulobacter sp.]